MIKSLHTFRKWLAKCNVQPSDIVVVITCKNEAIAMKLAAELRDDYNQLVYDPLREPVKEAMAFGIRFQIQVQ